MLVLRSEEVEKLVDMEEAIELVEDAMAMLSSGKCEVPLRTRFETEKGVILFMPAFSKKYNMSSEKIVSVFQDNPKLGKPPVPATVILVSGETGEVVAMMDGTVLTKIRTGAVQGVSTKILSREDSRVALVIGCGSQAPYQIDALMSVRKIERIYTFDVDFEKSEKLARYVSKKYGIEAGSVKDPNSVLKECDIVIAVTTSKSPVFAGDLVKGGTHIVGVGSFTPDMQEIDEKVVERAKRVYVDTKEGVLSESGDVIVPIEKGIISKEDVIELGEVILGKREGRRSEDEITFFKTVGNAIFDLAVARFVYEKAVRSGVGTVVEIS